jgi:hypothetical protein
MYRTEQNNVLLGSIRLGLGKNNHFIISINDGSTGTGIKRRKTPQTT